MKNNFIIYNSFYEPIKSLSDEQLGKLFRAIFDYTINGEITQDNEILIAFMFIKNQIDIDSSKWEQEKTKRSEAGRLGGIKRALNQKQTLSSKSKQCLGELSNAKQTQANQGDNVNVNDNVNNKKENIKRKKYFENEELNNIFLEFLEIRKKIKAVNSERAINSLLKKLEPYDDKTKYSLIERSVVNSWKDIYDNKNDNYKKDNTERTLKQMSKNGFQL
jgi:hypothetical protein